MIEKMKYDALIR